MAIMWRSLLALKSVMLLVLSVNGSSFYTSASSVKNLDPKSFQKEVLNGNGIWMVEFYAPWCGHCKNLAPEWKKAAKALDGIVNVAAVDCDQHKSLAGQFGVQGFPTIKIFSHDKKKPIDYQGERSAKGIVDAAIRETSKVAKLRLSGKSSSSSSKQQKKDKPKSSKSSSSSSDVVTLTDDNFDSLVLNSGDVWLVEFYAPWCGHCKQLAPEWEQAATELKGSVKIGALDATAHERKASEYGIKGFPTIKLFGSAAMTASDAQDYQGPRQASDIVSYALNKLDTMGGGMKLPQILSSKHLVEHCAGKSICVMAFLPHIVDSLKDGREKYLSEIENTAKLVRGKPFRFGWMQGGDQLDLESAFELTFGYPSVLAISLDKQRYTVQRGAFDSKSIGQFLNDIFSGKTKTIPYNTLPKLQTVTAWDGKDMKMEELAGDDDDDDIMSEILNSQKDEL